MITFWRASEKPYGCFSNFFRCDVVIDGKIYPSTEHYYQSQKTNDVVQQEKIRTSVTPKEAKRQAKMIEMIDGLPIDWESIKYHVMKKALMAKFTQHLSLKQLLLDTLDQELAESSPYDAIWGTGSDGNGQNLLGKCLMEVRKEIKQQE